MSCGSCIRRAAIYACHVIFMLIFLPLFVFWCISEIIITELWRRCGPARRNPNRVPSKGWWFAFRSSKRRRLSVPCDTHVEETSSEIEMTDLSAKKAKGFFDLPYELREQIWLHVLSRTGVVYIENHPRAKKLIGDPQALEEGNRRERVQYSLTSMLKLNRIFYREGITILYEHNTFSFTSANVLTSFSRTTLPQRLSVIRHLTLSIHCPTIRWGVTRYYNSWQDSEWEACCKALRKFTGLKTLTITILIEGYMRTTLPSKWHGFMKSQYQMRILTPLEPVSASQGFVVKYSWPRTVCSRWPRGKFRMEHIPGYA